MILISSAAQSTLDNRALYMGAKDHSKDGNNKRGSEYIGVSKNFDFEKFPMKIPKWQVYASLNSNTTYLGAYADEVLAARIFDFAVI